MKDLICIMCPKGCHLKVDEEHGYTVTGNRCPRGAEYGHNELKNPTRVITSTVRLRSKSACRLPVKTDGQIPKYMMKEAMRLLDKVEVTAPVPPVASMWALITMRAKICSAGSST